MSVDHFWRRTPPQLAAGLEPAQLADLVPYWFDEAYPAEREQGMIVGMEDTGDLVGRLLVLGAGDGPYRDVARRLSRGPADFDDEAMVGTFGPDVVGPAAQFLSDPPVRQWLVEHTDALAGYARELGYGRPFESFADSIVTDTLDLAAIVRQAAAEGEIIIQRIVA